MLEEKDDMTVNDVIWLGMHLVIKRLRDRISG